MKTIEELMAADIENGLNTIESLWAVEENEASLRPTIQELRKAFESGRDPDLEHHRERFRAWMLENHPQELERMGAADRDAEEWKAAMQQIRDRCVGRRDDSVPMVTYPTMSGPRTERIDEWASFQHWMASGAGGEWNDWWYIYEMSIPGPDDGEGHYSLDEFPHTTFDADIPKVLTDVALAWDEVNAVCLNPPIADGTHRDPKTFTVEVKS